MRNIVILAAALSLSLATPAFANPHVDRIVAMLQSDGYSSIEIVRTWLGRIRIEAEKDELEREIVINRSTGEILRDYIESPDLFSFDDDDDNDDEEGDHEDEDSEESDESDEHEKDDSDEDDDEEDDEKDDSDDLDDDD